MTLLPLHEVRDAEKLASITASMQVDGWVGRPVLALDCGDYLQAITGSHRIAAALAAGLDAETYIIEQPIYTGNDEVADLYSSLVDGDDAERLEALTTLADLGLVSAQAVKIMAAEAAEA